MEIFGFSPTLAPEVKEESEFNESIDFWALGAVLYRLLEGKYPGEEIEFTKADEDAQDLIRGLLEEQSEQRLGWDNSRNIFIGSNQINDIKEHDFFETIQWLEIYTQRIASPL